MSERQPSLVLPPTDLVTPSYPRIDLSNSQKNWLKDRDPNCEFPYHHICTGILHLHHVFPQMYAQIVRGEAREEINDRTRILRVCENIHVGMLGLAAEPELIHPDQRQAHLDYQVDTHAFSDVAQKHRALALSGQIYWNGINDEVMLDIASFRTRIYERKYQKPYPHPVPKPR